MFLEFIPILIYSFHYLVLSIDIPIIHYLLFLVLVVITIVLVAIPPFKPLTLDLNTILIHIKLLNLLINILILLKLLILNLYFHLRDQPFGPCSRYPDFVNPS